MQWFVGRLIDHVHLRVRDFGASRRFYVAVLEALGYCGPLEVDETHLQADELYVEAGSGTYSNVHLAFQARSVAMVHAFYDAALANGGLCHGSPGLRAYHAEYYAAFVLDPDGNNVEAVHQGDTLRTADEILIRHAHPHPGERGD